MNEITTLLTRVLDGSARRQEALASNIANAATPGYQRRDVPFVNELKAAIETGNPDALAQWKPSVTVDRSAQPIRLEREFSALAENQLLYTTSVEILSRKYARLRSAIKGT